MSDAAPTDNSPSTPGGLATQSGWRQLMLRILLALAAVTCVALAIAVLALAFSGATPPPRNPFASGMVEPGYGGRIGATIAAMQSTFYQALTQGLQATSGSWGGFWGLLGVGFAYGVFHAAGPGHGKAVISGYLVANERTLARGIGLSFAAAVLQACVAIALALILALIFNATAAMVKTGAAVVEIVSFSLVALLGLALTWRKSGALSQLFGMDGAGSAANCDADCGHNHMPDADQAASARDWRSMAGVVLAAGMRPCSGALILLAFALSQQALAAGVAATFAMAAGTAITTSAIAAIAVFAKRLALGLASSDTITGARVMAALELLAAAFVLVTGVVLLWAFRA